MIVALQPKEIFVFGSNLAGRHGAGAARQAASSFGAEYGVGEGMTGQCYALPTLKGDLTQRSEDDLVGSIVLLYEACLANPHLRFLLTKVGCGLAGYSESYMRSLFIDPPKNLILPEDWLA